MTTQGIDEVWGSFVEITAHHKLKSHGQAFYSHMCCGVPREM
jgi:hypothetical protein